MYIPINLLLFNLPNRFSLLYFYIDSRVCWKLVVYAMVSELNGGGRDDHLTGVFINDLKVG